MHKDVCSGAIRNVHNDQNLGMDPVVQQLGNNPNKFCHISRRNPGTYAGFKSSTSDFGKYMKRCIGNKVEENEDEK